MRFDEIIALGVAIITHAVTESLCYGMKEIFYSSGDNFSLTCEGDFWFYTRTEGVEVTERIESNGEIRHDCKVADGETCRRILYFENASYLATGHYNCYGGILEVPDNMVYLYVGDQNHLLAVKEEITPIIVTSESYITEISCKPTASGVNISLSWGDNRCVLFDCDVQKSNDPDDALVEYDPHIGYTFKSEHLLEQMENHGLYLHCNGYKDGHSDLKIFVLRRLYDAPVIKISTHHAVVGQDVKLSCYMPPTQITDDHFFNSSSMSSLNWILPNQEANLTNRIMFEDLEIDETENYILSFTIINVTKQDEGYYKCQSIHNASVVSDETFLKIYPNDEPFVNLSLSGDIVRYNGSEGSFLYREITLVSYPNARLIWEHPKRGRLFDDMYPKKKSKYYIKTKHLNKKWLIIRNGTKYDSGNYSVTAFNRFKRSVLDVEFNIEEKPRVKINDIKEYYPFNITANISCDAVGNPLPKIDWIFLKCNLEACVNSNESLYHPSVDIQLDDPYAVQSVLQLDMKESGHLLCTAIGGEEITSRGIDVLVTDVPEGFRIIKEPPDPIIEGDNVTLTCSVNSYIYYENLTWSRLSSDKRDDGGHLNFSDEYKNSYSSQLIINNITYSDADMYFCHAFMKNGTEKKYEVQVNVSHMHLFNGSNWDLSNQTWRIGSSLSFQCDAEDTGLKITWYKDGQVISSDTKLSYELKDNNQRLLIKDLSLDQLGKYYCVAVNKMDHDKTMTYSLAAVGAIAFAVFIILVGNIYAINRRNARRIYAARKKFEKGMPELVNNDLPLEHQTELLPYDRTWEFPRKNLKFLKQLGAGAFGVVMKAEAIGILEKEEKSIVAVKMCKGNADPMLTETLAAELKIMIHLKRHLNIVNLLGACTKKLHRSALYVIVEFCPYGNIRQYLLDHRDDFIDQIDADTGEIDVTKGKKCSRKKPVHEYYNQIMFQKISNGSSNATSYPPSSSEEDSGILSANIKGDYISNNIELTTSTLVSWAYQIARGMEYLGSKRVLHGDLAARNILLSDNNVVKICDFGLAKNIYNNPQYQKTIRVHVPVKWLAIESVTQGIYTAQSDVWSYGIVLWEIFSLAMNPYRQFQINEILIQKIQMGYRMEKPPYANEYFYRMMRKCWDSDPLSRPTFSELVEKLCRLMANNFKENYIKLNDLYSDISDPEENIYEEIEL